MLRRTALPAVALLLTGACGVSSEDKPQLIEDSTSQSPEATPSVDTQTGPLHPPRSSSSTAPTTTPTPTETHRSAGGRNPAIPVHQG
jgi:hypothetical protein